MAQKYNPFLTPKFKRELVKRIKDKYQDIEPTKIDYGYGNNPIKEEYLIMGITEAQITNEILDENFELDGSELIFNNIKINGEKLRLYEITALHELEFQNMSGVEQRVLGLTVYDAEVISGNGKVYKAKLHRNTKFDIPHRAIMEILEDPNKSVHYEINAYVIFFSGWSICTTIKVHRKDRVLIDEPENFLGEY